MAQISKTPIHQIFRLTSLTQERRLLKVSNVEVRVQTSATLFFTHENKRNVERCGIKCLMEVILRSTTSWQHHATSLCNMVGQISSTYCIQQCWTILNHGVAFVWPGLKVVETSQPYQTLQTVLLHINGFLEVIHYLKDRKKAFFLSFR